MLIAYAPPRLHDQPVAPRRNWIVEEARIHDSGGTNGAWPDAFFVVPGPTLRCLSGYPGALYLGGLVRCVQRGPWLPAGADGQERHSADYVHPVTARVISATPGEILALKAILARMRGIRTRMRRGLRDGRRENYVIPWGLD